MTNPPAREHLRRSLVPTLASVAIHAALFAAIVGVTVEQLAPTEPRPRLLDIDAVPSAAAPHQPPPPESRTDSASPAPTPAALARADAEQARRAETAREQAGRAAAAAADAPPPVAPPPTAPPPVVRPARAAPAATFAGVEARAATRIVYAVDASGAMVHTLSFILDELQRSIDRLQPTQSFQIVLFSDLAGDAPDARLAPIQPGRDGLIRATPRARQAVREWLGTIVAGGRSNPLDGLDAALRLDPDLIFLLARGIQRTGPANAAEPDPDAALARLDTLNPVDPKTGLRPAVIKTIQFVEPDPSGLLPRIARIHGDGQGSDRLVTPDDFGATPDAGPRDELPEPIARALARGTDALADLEANLTTLAVLAGVATPQEIAAVRTAADAALEALAEVPPATTRTQDGRPQLLRARAAVLRAATDDGTGATDAFRRQDLAARAIADAAPLPIIDPALSADRDLTLAAAHRLTGSPRRAHDDLLTLIANREDLRLDAPTTARARIALLSAADAIDPESAEADRARAALAEALDRADRETAWSDPPWRVLAASAIAKSLAHAGRPPAQTLAPLLAELDRPAVAEPHRRALLGPRLAVLAESTSALPPIALRALADHAAALGRTEEAAALLARAADTDGNAESRAAAIRDAAALYRSIDHPRAADLFFRLATEHPDHPDVAAALTIALDAPDADPARLRTALDIAPEHPLANDWRTRLARQTRGVAGLDLLDRVTPPTSAAASLALELIDELRQARPDDADLLRRASRYADSAGAQPARRLALAQGLLAATPPDPAAALDALDAIGPDSPEADRADLLRMRARLASGNNAAAFTLAERLASRREPSADAVFWEAITTRLELAAANGGPDARAAARAHVARLRLDHPDLGGEPWASRLRALGR